MTCLQSASSFRLRSALVSRIARPNFHFHGTMERKQRARRTELEARKLAALFARALNISSLSEDRGGEGAKTTPSGRPELATSLWSFCFEKLRLHHLKLVMFEKSSENRAFEFVRLRVSSSFLTLSFFFVTTCWSYYLLGRKHFCRRLWTIYEQLAALNCLGQNWRRKSTSVEFLFQSTGQVPQRDRILEKIS